eukprot:COSAG03_NODE_22832_length_286_cov_1.048128_1_plen_24_part_01
MTGIEFSRPLSQSMDLRVIVFLKK